MDFVELSRNYREIIYILIYQALWTLFGRFASIGMNFAYYMRKQPKGWRPKPPKGTTNMKVTLNGGFHNSQRTIQLTESLILSKRQFDVLQRGFCGVSNCQCGGIFRDTKIEGVDGAKYAIDCRTPEGGLQLISL